MTTSGEGIEAGSLAEPIRLRVEVALRGLTPSETEGVYALSFYLAYEDMQHPALMVGFNTEANWEATVDEASSRDEARWNCAFWLQNQLAWFGEHGTPAAAAVEDWLKARGLVLSEDAEDDIDQLLDLEGDIAEAFAADVCRAALALHEDGTLQQVFGHPVPVIVHRLEYDDEIAALTESANPPGLAADFIRWVMDGCE